MVAARKPGRPERELQVRMPQHVAPPVLRVEQILLGAGLESDRVASLQAAGKEPLVGEDQREQVIPAVPLAVRVRVHLLSGRRTDLLGLRRGEAVAYIVGIRAK